MGKWLAAATAAVFALLAFLWLQIREPAVQAHVAPKQVVAAVAVTPEQSRISELRKIGEQVASVEKKAGKLDPKSDAFF
jgi:hypothetical protein